MDVKSFKGQKDVTQIVQQRINNLKSDKNFAAKVSKPTKAAEEMLQYTRNTVAANKNNKEALTALGDLLVNRGKKWRDDANYKEGISRYIQAGKNERALHNLKKEMQHPRFDELFSPKERDDINEHIKALLPHLSCK